jgi:hypothetical protein
VGRDCAGGKPARLLAALLYWVMAGVAG